MDNEPNDSGEYDKSIPDTTPTAATKAKFTNEDGPVRRKPCLSPIARKKMLNCGDHCETIVYNILWRL